MSETAENGSNTPENGESRSTGDLPSCGPGCSCGEAADKGNTKIKIAVCLVVVVAVCGILLFKTTGARQNAPDIGTKGFSSPFAVPASGAVLNSTKQQGGSGAVLSAIAELNTVAAKLDTVFLIIPAKDNAPPAKETSAAITSAERTLNAKGLSTGLFILRVDSQDYPDVATKVKTPGIAVLTKGRGIGFADGSVSETSLMQAYVASTRGGGCGPGGCPTNGGNSKVPCN